MTKESVQDEIKKKFKTMTRFAQLADIDYAELQRDFISKKYITTDKLREMKALIRKTESIALQNDLTPAKIEKLRIKIDECGGVYKFCQDNKQFVQSSVYQILAGKYFKISGKVKQLFDHFKMK